MCVCVCVCVLVYKGSGSQVCLCVPYRWRRNSDKRRMSSRSEYHSCSKPRSDIHVVEEEIVVVVVVVVVVVGVVISLVFNMGSFNASIYHNEHLLSV